jgi:uncharacterized membrane protein
MRTRAMRRVAFRYAWDRLKVSFWFAPLVMSLGAILLVGVMNCIDGRISNEILQNSRLVLSGSVGELRTTLVGMATTILATAGVVFSLLTLPLSTVAAQYGSRLLRLFLGDRTTQFVLGMFVGTFVYCLSAALSIPPIEVHPEAPQLLVSMGLFLMLATFASLILLVQHISTMLQAPNIAAAAGADLLAVIRAEFTDLVEGGDGRNTPISTSWDVPEPLVEADANPVRVKENGYIQYIDPHIILPVAQEKNLVIHLLHKPGDYVSFDTDVALVWPADKVDQRVKRQLRHAFQVGNWRTPTQDVAYAVNQLVEMAVRAMSPAINDPFTAMTCLDYIGEGLSLFAQQGEKSSHYYSQDGRLRLVLDPVTFEDLLNCAFEMLRHCSCDNASVLLHMLEAIDVIGREAKSPKARHELLRHVDLIQAESVVGALIEQDRQRIQSSAEALQTKWKGT